MLNKRTAQSYKATGLIILYITEKAYFKVSLIFQRAVNENKTSNFQEHFWYSTTWPHHPLFQAGSFCKQCLAYRIWTVVKKAQGNYISIPYCRTRNSPLKAQSDETYCRAKTQIYFALVEALYKVCNHTITFLAWSNI